MKAVRFFSSTTGRHLLAWYITMKTVICLIICFFIPLSYGSGSIRQAMAQNTTQDPEINLTIKNKPLGDILETISQDTGYQFNLNDKWKDYQVSASNDNLPLERKLKRLLRSLNHIIIWDSDRIVTIKIFGEVDPQKSRRVASPPVSRRIKQAKTKPVVKPDSVPATQAEPADVNVKETHITDGEEDGENPETGDDESTPQGGDPDGPAEQDSSETDAPPDDTTA